MDPELSKKVEEPKIEVKSSDIEQHVEIESFHMTPKSPSKTGHRRKNEKSQKLFESNVKTNPNLPYVDLSLSSIDNSKNPDQHIDVRALYDTGCAKSVLKTSVFNKLLEHGFISVQAPVIKTVLVAANGDKDEITGMADIVMHFSGENNTKMSFELNVIVHPKLTQDFLLGSDFSGSDYNAFVTAQHLYLTNRYDVYLHTAEQALKDKTLCKVPLIRSHMSPMHVAANSFTVIPPFSHFFVNCTLQKSANKKYQLPLQSKGLTTFETLSSTVPRLKTLPMAMQYEKTNQIPIFLYNPTHEDMLIEQGQQVAEIHIWKDEYESHSLDVYMQEDEEILMECNNASIFPSFIDDDPALNDEEKESAFKDFKKTGYHHPSMTKVMKDRSSLTELILK